MTDAQKKFCNEYLKTLNATQAYKVAYPKCKKDDTARANSSRLLTKANIKEYIAEKMEERAKRTEVTQDKVIEEFAKIAFLNPKKLFDDDGCLKDISQIDDTTAGAIAGIEVFEEYQGQGENREYVGRTKKIKIADKVKALENLGRHLGMFKDKLEITRPTDEVIDEIDKYIQEKMRVYDK